MASTTPSTSPNVIAQSTRRYGYYGGALQSAYSPDTAERTAGLVAPPLPRPLSREPPQEKRPVVARRTVFTRPQLQRMEERFRKQSFLSREERIDLGQELDLTERQIMIWFQNRRGRFKKRGATDKAFEEKQANVAASRGSWFLNASCNTKILSNSNNSTATLLHDDKNNNKHRDNNNNSNNRDNNNIDNARGHNRDRCNNEGTGSTFSNLTMSTIQPDLLQACSPSGLKIFCTSGTSTPMDRYESHRYEHYNRTAPYLNPTESKGFELNQLNAHSVTEQSLSSPFDHLSRGHIGGNSVEQQQHFTSSSSSQLTSRDVYQTAESAFYNSGARRVRASAGASADAATFSAVSGASECNYYQDYIAGRKPPYFSPARWSSNSSGFYPFQLPLDYNHYDNSYDFSSRNPSDFGFPFQ